MVRPRRFVLLLSAFLPLAAWAQDAQVVFGGLRQDTTLPVEVKGAKQSITKLSKSDQAARYASSFGGGLVLVTNLWQFTVAKLQPDGSLVAGPVYALVSDEADLDLKAPPGG